MTEYTGYGIFVIPWRFMYLTSLKKPRICGVLFYLKVAYNYKNLLENLTMVKHQNLLINSLNVTTIEVQDNYQPPALLIEFIGDSFRRLEFDSMQAAMNFIGEIENEIGGKLPLTNS